MEKWKGDKIPNNSFLMNLTCFLPFVNFLMFTSAIKKFPKFFRKSLHSIKPDLENENLFKRQDIYRAIMGMSRMVPHKAINTPRGEQKKCLTILFVFSVSSRFHAENF